MLKQLQKTFSSLLLYTGDQDNLTENYQWFLTESNEIVGIDKNELTKKDTAILSVFLTPYNINYPILTEQERHWKKRINNPPINEKVSPYRFVYFSIRKNQINLNTFKEAIHEFFAKPVPILWENEQEGIIIEEQSSSVEENISYEQIIDVLMSDLYVKINFFVGPYLDNLNHINRHYKSFLKNAPAAFSYSEKSVVTYTDAVASLFVDQAESVFTNEIITLILQEFATDDEMLHTIKTFIHYNLNVTVTAKQLYMHRNSLQYRIDKFIEKTGIDIRQFNQAMTVHLALLANMHKSN